MDVYSELAVALKDADKARSWLQQIVNCHAEIVAQYEDTRETAYPFFEFLCLNGLTLVAIYRAESDIMLVGLEISDHQMIEMGNQMAMRDVPLMEEFLSSNSQLIRFGESVTLAALIDNAE
ncbi:MAG: hypothetical protein QNI99_19635 [Woeseiaceae bacterium]|nr:hypothetical protein [Woeseiaceae bacterium]